MGIATARQLPARSIRRAQSAVALHPLTMLAGAFALGIVVGKIVSLLLSRPSAPRRD